jgi:hypothetical protein
MAAHPVAAFHGMTNASQYFSFVSQTPNSRLQIRIRKGPLPDPGNVRSKRTRVIVTEQADEQEKSFTFRIKGMAKLSEGYYLLTYSPSVPMIPETNVYVYLELDDSKIGNDGARKKLDEWCTFWGRNVQVQPQIGGFAPEIRF